MYRRPQLTSSSMPKRRQSTRNVEASSEESPEEGSLESQQPTSDPSIAEQAEPVAVPRRSFKAPSLVETMSLEEVLHRQHQGMRAWFIDYVAQSTVMQLSSVLSSLMRKSFRQMVLRRGAKSRTCCGSRSDGECLQRCRPLERMQLRRTLLGHGITS